LSGTGATKQDPYAICDPITGFEAIENASVEEIRDLQTERLRHTLQHALPRSQGKAPRLIDRRV